MTEIQLIGIEVSGKPTVRTFGYRVDDEAKKTVEVVLNQATAADLIMDTERAREFPIIEVPENRWCFCIDTGNVPMLHHRRGPA